jgi:hypothetical protein
MARKTNTINDRKEEEEPRLSRTIVGNQLKDILHIGLPLQSVVEEILIRNIQIITITMAMKKKGMNMTIIMNKKSSKRTIKIKKQKI